MSKRYLIEHTTPARRVDLWRQLLGRLRGSGAAVKHESIMLQPPFLNRLRRPGEASHHDIARGLARPLPLEESFGGEDADSTAPQLPGAVEKPAILPRWMEGGAAAKWLSAVDIDDMVGAVREKMASLAVSPTLEHIALRIEAYLFVGQINRALDQVRALTAG
jgi:hypothetical protein